MADEKVANEDEQTDLDAGGADEPPPDAEADAEAAETVDAAAGDEEAPAEDDGGNDAPAADEASEFPADDLSDFGDDDLDDIEEGPEGGGKGGGKRRLIIYGASGLAAVLILAGASYFFFFSGGDEHAGGQEQMAEMQGDDDSNVPRVKLALPPKQQTRQQPPEPASQHGMTPPAPAGDSAMTPSPAGTPMPAEGAHAGAGAGEAATAKTMAEAPGSLNALASATATPGAGLIVPASTAAAFTTVPVQPADDPLPPAPDPALLQDAPGGPLPRIGSDGRQPWQVYARPFTRTTTNTPNIAIVITGLGLSAAATQAAIDRLPPDITLAFSPYTKGLQTWVISAREAGHEVLLGLPMQPVDFPKSDPGPYTLETELDAAENLKRLRTVLSRGAGYVGVIDMMGSGFSASEAALKPVFEELRRRGLLYVDSGAAPDTRAPKVAMEFGLPVATSLTPLDVTASAAAIDQRLADIEAAARRNGGALVIGRALPVTIARIAKWSRDVTAKNLRLAPVSAVVKAPQQAAKKTEAAAPAPAPQH